MKPLSLPDFRADELARVLEPLDRARPLPRPAFVDPAFFALDRAIIRSSWVPIAHVSELPSPGSFVGGDVGGDRTIVLRGPHLELAGFLDGCIHRGTLLFAEDAGCLERLSVTCPYHGLRYDLNGVADPASCPALSIERGARLRPVRVAERFGFVFVCLDPETPAFDAYCGPVPPWLERASFHALRLGRRTVHEAAANWKLCVQNFQESHHFTFVHPSLEARTPWLDSSSEDFGGAFMGGSMHLSDEVETVSDARTAEGRPPIAAPADRRVVRDALLFPLWMTSLQPDYFLSYRIQPLGVDVTRIVAEIYFHAAAFERELEARHVYSFWDRTNAEDRAICERQHRGLQSSSYELGAYATVEDGVHAFDKRIAAAYAKRFAR